jgi:hypothetical protein
MIDDLIKENRKLRRQVDRLSARGTSVASSTVERGLRTIQRRVQRALGSGATTTRRRSTRATSAGTSGTARRAPRRTSTRSTRTKRSSGGSSSSSS